VEPASQQLVEGALREVETRPESQAIESVRLDGHLASSKRPESSKRANKNNYYGARRLNQETSMVLSILNRWQELDIEAWKSNQETFNRSIQAIRDTLLELAEILAEAGGVNVEQK
jgi:hypothetical protein